MEENLIEIVNRKAIKLPSGKYAMVHNGRMIILEKMSDYGTGYRSLVSFSFNDFEELKKLGNSDEARIY